MGYDPNDPNQDSQAPIVNITDQSTPEGQARNAVKNGSVNDLVRSRPAIATWLAQHNDGRNLSDSDQQTLFALMRSQGIDPRGLEIDDNGTISSPNHTVRDIVTGALIAFGPIVAGWAVPLIAGAGGGAGAAGAAGATGGVESGVTAGLGSTVLPGAGTALGGAGATYGGATAAGGAGAAAGAGATTAGGSVIPAATYGPGGAVSSFSTVAPQGATYSAAGGGAVSTALRYGIPAATDLISGFIQANATEKASDKQAALLQQALDYEKSQDALNRTIAADKVKLEAGRYATYTGNISPYLQSGNAANNKMTSLLGLPQNAPMTAPPQTTITPNSAPANVTTQPLPRSADQTVTMRGPDGSQKQVPANQVDHYKQLGATVIGAVA